MPLIPLSLGLPAVKTLADCSDYSKTVAPFIDQLYALPQNVLSSATDLQALKQLYISTNPLVFAFALSLFFAVIFLIVSEANRNYSQVDRCWSLLPTFYNAHYAIWAHLNGLPAQRLDILLAVSSIWSARLTFNYWRKGGYSIGSEDYRWEIVRKRAPGVLFFILNVTFISTIQSVLLFAVTTPTYILMLASRIDGGATTEDYLFGGALLFLVVLEFISDNQQWDYQSAKQSYRKTAKVPAGFDQADLDRGFISTGLWAYSRHPNFAAEQSVWVLLYQWACYTSFSFANWTFCGAFSYLLLFQGSTWLTELITSQKYPEYKFYQERVGKFLPVLVGPSWAEYVERQKTEDAKKK